MNTTHILLLILLFAVPAFAQQSAATSTNDEVAALIEGICPAVGMSEDEVQDRWGKPTSVNSPGRHFLNPPEGFSHWSYRSPYRGEKLDGPAKTEDAFRLFVYFIHGRAVGSELESRRDVVDYTAHISCSTSGISSTFSPPTTTTNPIASTEREAATLVSVLRDYRDAWKAGHDPETPWKAHFVMNHCPTSLTPRLVAEAFRFPGQLDMVDARGTDQRHGRGAQPLWSAAFAGHSNTFARTHIFGYRQGTFVTPELEDQYEAALQNLQTKANASNWFLRFELPGNVRGYIRTGFGGCMLIASAPPSGLDLMMSIDLPNGDAGPFYTDTPATHEYYGSVHKNPVQLLRTAFPDILEGLDKEAQPSGGAYGSPAAGSPSAHP
jgi:hypothetical protein